jgi:hypothetical protein
MSPKERAVACATVWNANNPAHFPGRPLFEGLIENAIKAAEDQIRKGIAEIILGRAEESRGLAWFHPENDLTVLAEQIKKGNK